MNEILEFFRREDKFAQHCGIELLDVGAGFSRVKMELQPYHLNGLGGAHGGAIFTLADFAFAAACNSHGTVAVALNVSISYVRAVAKGVLYAQAEEISRGNRTGNYVIRVMDEEKRLVAMFNGLAFRKPQTLEELRLASARD